MSQLSSSTIPGLTPAQSARSIASLNIVNTFSQLATMRSSYGVEVKDALSPHELRLYNAALEMVTLFLRDDMPAEDGTINEDNET